MNPAQTSALVALLDPLHEFIERYPRLFVLSGAGISTESGIPCYRDEEGQRTGRAPILLKDFIGSEFSRKRYWARSMIGWPMVAGATPNAAHLAVARLERLGVFQRLVTQNVDGLHTSAGNTDVIELHGNIGRVRCMECGDETPRAALQQRLIADNPGFVGLAALPVADGDAQLEGYDFNAFHAPPCLRCGGMLKPDVVFFGEGVPRTRVDAAAAALDQADAMLVIGSSLMVYSGFRFCEWAARAGKPIAAVNLGRTRADALLQFKVEAQCGPVLSGLADALERSR
ncbi:NAD-dependent deacetylase [Caballeronia sordidicola]|uniref:protein acetyllysine N-acetyltransferase n=1 Tax=Caballeronia sordidicola TaxID=196367 RepID=A0A158GT27_CABSO|nr:NAD-dependent protein deacetylase [Caballeronia sordidicola]SAL35248.1 NAD-dependent deacetylase [Caballeronia sordidicola]